jgi:hypothetical protein
VGGVAEATAGFGLGVATSWTGIGAVAGGAVGIHGLDQVQAGFRELISGCRVDSFTSRGLQAAGVSRSTSNLMDAGISVVGSLGAGTPSAAKAAGGIRNIGYYEAGQSTMSAGEFAKYGEITNNVERGMARVADKGWLRSLFSGAGAPSQFFNTVPKGGTPLGWGGGGALGGIFNALSKSNCGCAN